MSAETTCRPIPEFDGYRVSDTGIVQSCWRRVPGTKKASGGWVKSGQWRTLSVDSDRRGYLRVNIWRCGKMYHFLVHRLVLTAFVSPCPEGMEGCHDNGNHVDNRLENLRWGTPDSNEDDIKRHGKRPRGSRCKHSKLSEKDVVEILNMRQDGHTLKAIGEKFSVHFSTIAYITNGQNWRHVPRE